MKNSFSYLNLIVLLLLPFLLMANGPQVTEIEYNDSWADEGFNLIHSDGNSVRVTFSIEKFVIRDVTINGEKMQEIELPGVFLPAEAGAPNLPGTGRFIAVPEGSIPNLKILNIRKETMKGLNIAPAPEIPLETEDGLEYIKNESLFSMDGLYPAKPVKIAEKTEIRGVDAVMLGVTPFQYNPSSGELTVIRDVTVEITFEGGNGQFGEERLLSRWWDRILSDAFLNSNSVPKASANTAARGTNETGYEYLIITPDNQQFISWADSIKEWRTLQGIKTGVVTLTDIGSNSTSAIEVYINNAYNSWTIPPAAVLLMADYGTSGTTSIGINSPIYNNYCISDHIYADVNGNHMADIAFARMTANNTTQLATMVQKVLDYERNPPTSASFYDNPITAMGWQTERWFQLCSETVNGFFEYELGKSPVRENAIYSGSPGGNWSTATNTSTVVNYFGPGGLGYIPSTTNHLTDWGGNATRVNNDINSGAFILQHRDHGSTSGWGEPDYGTSDLSGLNNTDLTFVFSVNCLTGKFDHSSETFAEAFHRYPKRALGIIAATEVSYSFVNDAYVWGAYDYMWPQFMPTYAAHGSNGEKSILPAFANVAGKYFLQQSSWPYNTNNKEVTYYLFHHHGDAFSTVYSEIPQYLSVVHNPVLLAGASTFNVSADSGSFICLSHNGEILATADGTGSPVSMNITQLLPGDEMIVTVTKQDYYRYSQTVQVIPPSGPYVIHDAVILNDANQNGNADYSEEIYLSLKMKNVGIAAASNTNISISSNDPWITILDSSETYGNIAADSSMAMTDGFKIRVADSIIDGHSAKFDVSATDGTDIWSSFFNLALHAPVLELPGITIIDSTGNNNGLPEPGETVTAKIEVKNDGSAETTTATQHLLSTSPYVSISGSPYTFSSIPDQGTNYGEFTVTIDSAAPNGINLDLISHLSSSPYSTDKVFYFPVGEANEDFESGDFNQYNWVTGGNSSWILTTQQPYEGLFCAKSGYIGNQSSTYLQVTLDVLADGTISFYRKVSTENNYDFLEFYIDNNKMGQWSGSQGWAQESYTVTAGTHTFKWVYDKDYWASGGYDAVWIDYIKFPPIVSPGSNFEVRATAVDNALCEGESTTLYAITTGGGQNTNLQWFPTASISDPGIYNPVANPMLTTNYIVIATASGGSDTASVMVDVNPMPVIDLGNDTSICGDATISLDAGIPGGVEYSWSPSMGNNAVIQVDSTGVGYGSISYTVTATDDNGCQDDDAITITFVNCAGLDDLGRQLGIEVYPNPSSGKIFIRHSKVLESLHVKLLNVNGTLVRAWESGQDETTELDLSGLSKGVYMLNFTTDKGSETRKIILQ